MLARTSNGFQFYISGFDIPLDHRFLCDTSILFYRYLNLNSLKIELIDYFLSTILLVSEICPLLLNHILELLSHTTNSFTRNLNCEIYTVLAYAHVTNVIHCPSAVVTSYVFSINLSHQSHFYTKSFGH